MYQRSLHLSDAAKNSFTCFSTSCVCLARRFDDEHYLARDTLIKAQRNKISHVSMRV